MSAAVVENSGNPCQPAIEERVQDVESEEESREFESMNSSTLNGEDDRTEDLEEEQIDPGSDKDEDNRFVGYNSRLIGEAISDEQLLASYKLSPDTNKLLRDIIQNRERKLQAMRLANGQSPIQMNGTDHNAMINQLLQDREMYRNGELNLDMSLVSQSMSNLSDESDNEMDKNQNKRSCSSPLISPGGSSSGQLSPSDPEAMKVKRARVENIVTGMRMSPSAQPKSESGNPPPEKRSNKRKQYQPQQHDVRLNDEDEPVVKRGRIEKDNLKDQLKQMQQQLVEMQQKYIQLFEKTSAAGLDTVDGCVNIDSFNKTSQCKETNNNNTKLDEKTKSSGLPFINLENKDMEPSHFIDQVCKLVKEQEVKISKPSTNVLPSKTSIEELAKSIKCEIRDVISNTVDTVVTKFLQENKLKLKHETAPEPQAIQEKLQTPTPVPQMPRVSTPNKSEQKPPKTKVTDKTPFRIPDLAISNGFHDPTFHPLPAHHPFHPFPLFGPALHHHHSLFHVPKKEPEQTEALPLIVSTPKKKRTKVTDTRLSPRAARALLHENPMDAEKMMMHPLTHDGYPLIPVSLPTSVAIPNPGLQHSDIMAMHNNPEHHSAFHDVSRSPPIDHFSPNGRLSPPEGLSSMGMSMSMPMMMRKDHRAESLYGGGDRSRSETPTYDASMSHVTTTLTPMHLRKAKLMFFFVRYPSSAILKVYFPDIKFNKNNTAQLVKWFSNFREFYYIQMEKYARQSIAEGVKSAEDLIVTSDCELYRVLNLHYNRNNQIEVPDSFRSVVQSTLREFFRSVIAGKDSEQSWKKSIYKVIARMDDPMPEFFKSPNWMEQLGEQ